MLQPGNFLAERYEILDRIGTGGMSEVYKAKDHILDRHVAIKVLKAEFAQDMTFVTKFRTEAQSAAGLEHPNIVNVYDVGSQDGMYFIIMEYIEGITLKTYIDKKGRLTFKEAVSIAIQVSRGIEAAHNKGIVHRDIKPQNIMISSEGKVKVTDFGIARASSGNTVSTEAMGSVHYISPEQARNGFVDGRTDIYSLGIVMYEMLAGKVPFDGENAISIAIQHLQNEITPPSAIAPGIPVSVEGIILKCTQKSPDKRYSSVSDLIIDLKKSLINPDEPVAVISAAAVAAGASSSAEGGLSSFDSFEHNTTAAGARGNAQPQRRSRYEDEYDEYDDEDDDDYDDDDYDDDEDEGGFMSPKTEKIMTIIGIVAAAIIVVLIIYLGGSMLGVFGGKDKDTDKDAEKVTTEEIDPDDEKEGPDEEVIRMINVVGLTEAQAKELLKGLGLGYKCTGYESSDDISEDLIASQSVEEGEEVEPNTTIEVKLSSGKGEISVPDVVGKTQADATSLLKEAGFAVATASASSDTVEEGKVLQSKPAAGYKLKAGETVTITISSGKNLVKVPSGIVKEDSTKVATILTNAGLKWTVKEEYSDTVEKGWVISCTPAEGTEVKAGSSIEVVVSLGPKSVAVPNLNGLSEAQIQSALQEKGLTYAKSEDYSDTVVAGSIISFSPGYGENVAKGTTVTVKWSKGRALTIPGGLVGAAQETAIEALKNAGITNVKIEIDSNVAENTVQKCSHSQGAVISEGDTVTIWVGKGTTQTTDPNQNQGGDGSNTPAANP